MNPIVLSPVANAVDASPQVWPVQRRAAVLVAQLAADSHGGVPLRKVRVALRQAGVPTRDLSGMLTTLGLTRRWQDGNSQKVAFDRGLCPGNGTAARLFNPRRLPKPVLSPELALACSRERAMAAHQRQAQERERVLQLLSVISTNAHGALRLDLVGVALKRAGVERARRHAFLDALGAVRWREGAIDMVLLQP